MPPTPTEQISALSHPLRRRILVAYAEERVECVSATELAAVIGQRVGQVAYHLKTLGMMDILLPVHSGCGQEAHYGWALGVDAEWLRQMLEV